jgi:1-deoxy-D-xylulose-5-phosphate synthase
MLLESINSPTDLGKLDYDELGDPGGGDPQLHRRGGLGDERPPGLQPGRGRAHLALHRVFSSPRDILLWDTGHQAYVHKILTGRREMFTTLRQTGGLSGYPSRAESVHDWVENSHASTILSYAHGLSAAVARSSTPTAGWWRSSATGP